MPRLPSVRTINRILARHGLTHRRTGRYLRVPVRFWSLNKVDIATARCATVPVRSRARQATVDALGTTWRRLGCPDAVQADNEWAFFGSPAHPRALGPMIPKNTTALWGARYPKGPQTYPVRTYPLVRL